MMDRKKDNFNMVKIHASTSSVGKEIVTSNRLQKLYQELSQLKQPLDSFPTKIPLPAYGSNKILKRSIELRLAQIFLFSRFL